MYANITECSSLFSDYLFVFYSVFFYEDSNASSSLTIYLYFTNTSVRAAMEYLAFCLTAYLNFNDIFHAWNCDSPSLLSDK